MKIEKHIWQVEPSVSPLLVSDTLLTERHLITEACYWIDTGITSVELADYGNRYLPLLDLLGGYRYKFARLTINWVVSIALNCPNARTERDLIHVLNRVADHHGLPVNETGQLNVIDFIADLKRVGFTDWAKASLSASQLTMTNQRIADEIAERELELGFTKPILHE